MKRYIYILTILTVSVMTVGCIKETLPKGSTLTEEQLEKADDAAVLGAMINGLPASMMTANTGGFASKYSYHADYGIPSIHLMTDYMLEDITVGGNLGYSWYNSFHTNVSMGAAYVTVGYIWVCYYKWIKGANDVIKLAGEITDDTDAVVRNYVGQAYAYRALCYLDLARLYEPRENKILPVTENIKGLTVPIVTEKTTEKEAISNPRAHRDTLYKFIMSDLNKAEAYLDSSKVSYKYPTLAAVYGMKARLYLEMGAADDGEDKEAYRQAYKYAGLAIEKSGKTPLTETQWHDPVNGFNNGATNNSWIWGLTSSIENLAPVVSYVAHMSCEAVWAYGTLALPSISKALYDQIDYGDFRKLSWLDPEKTWKPGTEKYDPDNEYQFAGEDETMVGLESMNIYTATDYFLYDAKPYSNLKFRPKGGICTDYSSGSAADHVLMRVEEMYFIQMEAALRIDGRTAAQKLLNDFMQSYRNEDYDCSVTTGSEEAFIREMILQKRIEFWGEGILMFDYKRLNLGITRGYKGTNIPATARFNCEGRSPQWNLVIPRNEYQVNKILESTNNPDPSENLPLWVE